MRNFKIALVSFLTVVFFLPVFYVLYIMGTFSPAPKVEIHSTVKDKNAPVLKVVADYDFAPYSFLDSQNRITGLDVELVNEISNRLGMRPQIYFTDWPNCKKSLLNKDSDIILGLEIFSHMSGELKTVPTSEDELMIFGKKKIGSTADLKDKKVALMSNSIIERIFELNCDYVEYYTNSQVLAAVDKGEVDYGICHSAVAKKIIEKEQFDLYPAAVIMKSYPAIGVREDLPELKDKINEIIIQLSEEGFIKALDKKWLINFSRRPSLQKIYDDHPALFLFYGLFVFISVLLMVCYNIMLRNKRRANKKAEELQDAVTKQFDLLTSLSGIYHTMYIINLEDDSIIEMEGTDISRQYINRNDDATIQIQNLTKNTIMADAQESALEFTNLETLSERLKGKKSIIAEFQFKDSGWLCAQFITVETDENGMATEVIFTTRDINEIKIEQEKLLKLSNIDELTKLYNRHAFEEKLKELQVKNQKELTVVALDVNGLKATNDNIGHGAGDELICAAAACIQNVFGTIGFTYRTGGDEFVVIIEKSDCKEKELFEAFKKVTSEWHGDLIGNIGVSIGIAASTEIEDFNMAKFHNLIETADKRMYADKALYYKEKGIDRRSSR